jgi:hypothetical protein
VETVPARAEANAHPAAVLRWERAPQTGDQSGHGSVVPTVDVHRYGRNAPRELWGLVHVSRGKAWPGGRAGYASRTPSRCLCRVPAPGLQQGGSSLWDDRRVTRLALPLFIGLALIAASCGGGGTKTVTVSRQTSTVTTTATTAEEPSESPSEFAQRSSGTTSAGSMAASGTTSTRGTSD